MIYKKQFEIGLKDIGKNNEITNTALLERLENIEFGERKFCGGKIVQNKEINRIQIIFDNIPDEEIRNHLKHNGFHWSRKECAWQRLFNEQTIKVTNRLLKEVLNKEREEEEEFE